MAALSGAAVVMDVRHKVVEDKYFSLSGTMTFGDGSSTYPTGGIPITKGQLGFRNTLRGLYFSDESSSDGYVYKFDLATLSLRIYEIGASFSSPLTEVTTAYAPAAATVLSFEAEGY
jgi:hypothetical protein